MACWSATCPHYVREPQALRRKLIGWLQQHLGPDYVDAKLSELVIGQAGDDARASWRARSAGSWAAATPCSTCSSLAIVTPVVGFYLLRDWPRVRRAGR